MRYVLRRYGPQGQPAWLAGQARLVEPLLQGGLAVVLSTQRHEPLPERGRILLPTGERLQVPQQRYGQVIVAGAPRRDPLRHLLPGLFSPRSELVEPLLTCGRLLRRLA